MTISLTILWAGRILKGLLCLFLLFDGTMKIIKHSKSMESTIQLGVPANSIQFLGIFLLAATILYGIPRTSGYGILALLAYLGGATAVTYLSKPTTYGFLFPVVFAALVVIVEYMQNVNFRSILSLK